MYNNGFYFEIYYNKDNIRQLYDTFESYNLAMVFHRKLLREGFKVEISKKPIYRKDYNKK